MPNDHDNGTDLPLRTNETEADATRRIETGQRISEEADEASDAAVDALSAFMAQIQEAKKVLRERPDLVRALAAARSQIGAAPPREGQR